MQKIITIIRKWWLLFLVFGFPVLCIKIAGKNEWIGRLIALTTVFGLGMPIYWWWVLNPKSKFISKKAKFNQPRFKKIKPRIELLLRVIAIIAGLCFLLRDAIPLSIGTWAVLCGEKPVVVSGRTTSVTAPFPLLEVISQTIILEHKGQKTSYDFLYSLGPRLRRETKYELLLLPRSHLVLEAKQMKENKKQEK